MTQFDWKRYLTLWLPFVMLLTLASQGESMAQGRLDLWRAAGTALSLVPAILMLAWVRPIEARLAASGRSLKGIAVIHTLWASLFALTWHLLIYGGMALMGKGDNVPLYYRVWPFLFSMMMLYGSVAAIFSAVRASHAARALALQTAQAQGLLVLSELAALRNKLNPHFLFNTLHSIIALTRKDAKGAEVALLKFSDMLRYVLATEKSGIDRVTLEEELGFVRDYLDLEMLRLGPRLQVVWEVDPDALAHGLPALSVQPLVENSIKYAFNPRSQPGRLVLRAHVNAAASQLVISVGDDGPGARLDQVRASDGLGVKTVERRLQLEYGERASFIIETAPGAGFDARMSIPLDGSQDTP